MFYSKRHSAMNPPQSSLPCFKHTYSTIPATFCSSPGSHFSVTEAQRTMLSSVPHRQSGCEYTVVGLLPPYSPDLALGNFWLFPIIKVTMRSMGFWSIQDIKSATEDTPERGLSELLHQGARMMGYSWSKRESCEGDWWQCVPYYNIFLKKLNTDQYFDRTVYRHFISVCLSVCLSGTVSSN